MKGEWLLDLNCELCDDEIAIHHYCSNCMNLAPFTYTYMKDWETGIDYEDGIKEAISPYCPECGSRMNRVSALRDIYRCGCCKHEGTKNCHGCYMYPFAEDDAPNLFEISEKYI